MLRIGRSRVLVSDRTDMHCCASPRNASAAVLLSLVCANLRERRAKINTQQVISNERLASCAHSTVAHAACHILVSVEQQLKE